MDPEPASAIFPLTLKLHSVCSGFCGCFFSYMCPIRVFHSPVPPAAPPQCPSYLPCHLNNKFSVHVVSHLCQPKIRQAPSPPLQTCPHLPFFFVSSHEIILFKSDISSHFYVERGLQKVRVQLQTWQVVFMSQKSHQGSSSVLLWEGFQVRFKQNQKPQHLFWVSVCSV